MSDSPAAATVVTIDAKHAVNQPSFTLGAALRTAPASGGESGEEAEGQDQGDTVIISEQGKALAARQAQESSGDDTEEAAHIRQIKERIARLRQEIQEIQQDQTLDEDAKRQQLLTKESELAEMQTQLQEAYEEQAKAASASGKSANMTSLGSYGARS